MDNSVDNLHSNGLLWYKIHIFIYDLRHFQEHASQTRLDNVVDSSYLCLPYFTPAEVDQLKATIVQNTKSLENLIQETLDERLQRRIKKRVESGDFRVCAAHDLAPVFEKAFNIKPKDLERDRELQGLIEEFGLGINETQLKAWSGLTKELNLRARGHKRKEGHR